MGSSFVIVQILLIFFLNISFVLQKLRKKMRCNFQGSEILCWYSAEGFLLSFGPAVFTIRPYKEKYESEHISKIVDPIELCFGYDIGETNSYTCMCKYCTFSCLSKNSDCENPNYIMHWNTFFLSGFLGSSKVMLYTLVNIIFQRSDCVGFINIYWIGQSMVL